ncbi:MAG: Gfo/Idh/MocA family protein [Puniceicoccaceae bacterium]
MAASSKLANGRPSRPLRVGLIGATGYGFAYYEELTKLVQAGLVEWGAATIINPQDAPVPMQFFRANKVPVYDDYQKMLDAEADNLDWLCIPTAISWHETMAVDSLQRGVPVLLEKPMAPTLQGVAAIKAAEKASGLPVAIGFQHVYGRDTIAIKQRFLDGEIGELRKIESFGLWPRNTEYYERNNWAGKIRDNKGWVLDSPLHNALSHMVNMILYFAGPSLQERADVVAMEAELYRSKPIENFDTVRCIGNLDTGIQASLILSHGSMHRIDPEIRIHGTKGVYTWRFGGSHSLEVNGGIERIQTMDNLHVRAQMFEKVVRLISGEPGVDYCSTQHAEGEVKWVNAVQDTTPVHTVPKAFCRRLTDEHGDVFDSLHDLEYYALRSYHEGRSFAELDAPWAVEPGFRDLTGYTAFEGCHFQQKEEQAPVESTS